MILPQLEESAIYEQIQPTTQGGAANWALERTIIEPYHCPSAERPAANVEVESNYGGVAGPGRGVRRLPFNEPLCGDIHTDGVLFPQSRMRIAKIEDGTSNTLAIGEQTYLHRTWMSGATWAGKPPGPPTRICSGASTNVVHPINAELNQYGYYVGDQDAPVPRPVEDKPLNNLYFGSHHPGGAQFCFADGSVQFLDDAIDFTLFQDLSTRNGSEVLREGF
jgi:prepilin-type processing-associated H-X9-DG protein